MTHRSDRARSPVGRSLLVIVALTTTLSIYLFVQAPPPLAAPMTATPTIPIATVFAILENENDAARALWTQELVGHGKSVGLVFDERWREDAVHAGPLPALFLRETARNLELSSLRLSLFLGSPYPINTANAFSANQATRFEALASTGAPQMFFERETSRFTAMFPDLAIVDACVSCHNDHRDSPKHDWRHGDLMGATTWMYPDEHVTSERALELVAGLRTSIRTTYAAYLRKAATFPRPPEVGTRWPRDGYFLPDENTFMAELERRSSGTTLASLLSPTAPVVVAPPPTLAEAPPDSAQAPVAIVTDARPTLVIRAARSTRVMIDRHETRLLVARMRADGVLSVSYPPPLQIQVDDPGGVTIEYDGKPVATNGELIEIVADTKAREGS